MPPAPARLLALSVSLALTASALLAAPAVAVEPDLSTVETMSVAEAAQAEQRETATALYAEGIQALPALAGSVVGTLIVGAGDGSYASAQSLSSYLRFWRWDDGAQLWSWVRDVETFSVDGDFAVDGLEAGDYRIEFVSYDAYPVREYWDDHYTWFASDIVTLIDGVGLDLGTVTLDPTDIAFDRIFGSNRFATAVEISKTIISAGSAPVVYLVNGLGYADALTAGPAASRAGGVMLLTGPTALPGVVADELERLDPQRIVIVGGPALVSSAIEQAVKAYTPTAADVQRIFGGNRYETSRLLVDDAFGGGVPDLFIATGRNFPDALAAGPASSRLGGAVLLVDGALTTTDAATRALITALGTPDLHLAGGTGVISAAVEASLVAHVGGAATVERYAGANRYDTAAEINFRVFGPQGTDYAFVAGGAGFADALAGGPLAAAFDGPLYLSPRACLRSQDYIDMVLLLTQFAIGLGGTGVLSDRVLYGEFC